ncbi:hypothetical protein BGZ88_005991 [Linnemannia elongata]|nr:hypothetical protein BGZ88_005991 [Linnemannia elongata]
MSTQHMNNEENVPSKAPATSQPPAAAAASLVAVPAVVEEIILIPANLLLGEELEPLILGEAEELPVVDRPVQPVDKQVGPSAASITASPRFRLLVVSVTLAVAIVLSRLVSRI